MSEENVEIVRRGYELFAAGNLEGLAALISTDAETPDAGGLGLTGTATGIRHGPEGFLRASGVKQEARLAHLWVLRDGKAIRGEVYRTTEEALEAAELRE